MHRIVLCVSFLLLVLSQFCPATAATDPSLQPPQFRLSDDRPALDREKLTALGFHVVSSKRLVLITDLSLESVRDLPPLADALFDELQRQLGPLAPENSGAEFQVTGYLMDKRERFADAGLLPPETFQIRHGRNLGYQFWINNQTADYYRRHLLLHEFVHCFMMCEYGMQDIPPLWYTEGIAEYFATHAFESEVTQSRFGILPPATKGFEGWGRIDQIRSGFSAEPAELPESSEVKSLESVLHPPDNRFIEDEKYALAWALVWLIRNHPELKDDFSVFDRIRNRQQFVAAERAVSDAVWSRLHAVWPLFLDALIEGADATVSLPQLMPAPVQWAAGRNTPAILKLDAARDWQSTGFLFAKGQSVTLSCSGRYAVHNEPKPWISEPQGITIDYYRGRPLGEVVAIIVSPDGQFSSRRISVGTGRSIVFPQDAELWLQINDSAADRAGNSGTVEVRLTP